MRVAFATTAGSVVDEHFGRAGRFAVWEIGPDAASFVELRQVAEGDLDVDVVSTRGLGSLHEDAVATKIEKLSDVRIVYFTEIGGPSAAKLVRGGIMPLKTEPSTSIDELVEKLGETMRTNPAPWMRRAMGEQPSPDRSTPDDPGGTCSCASGGCAC